MCNCVHMTTFCLTKGCVNKLNAVYLYVVNLNVVNVRVRMWHKITNSNLRYIGYVEDGQQDKIMPIVGYCNFQLWLEK